MADKRKIFLWSSRCLQRFNRQKNAIEVFALHKKFQHYSITGVAKSVWERFDGKTPVAAIVSEILEEYDTDERAVKKDVDNFIQQLLAAGLIVEKGQEASAKQK